MNAGGRRNVCKYISRLQAIRLAERGFPRPLTPRDDYQHVVPLLSPDSNSGYLYLF